MQEIYDQAKKSCTVEFIPEKLYDWLTETGKLSLTKEEKWVYVTKAIERKIVYLEEQIAERSTTERMWELENYKKMIPNQVLKGKYKDEMYIMAQKLIVYDFMKKEKQTA